MTREPDGYWAGVVPEASAGMTYRYRLDGKELFPDPCSRFQPRTSWPVADRRSVTPFLERSRMARPTMHGQVIYELHIGAFTPEGTFDSAITQLDALKDLGISVIEVMPVAEFPGRWNWGYDGVGLFAPAHVYGDPDAMKRFVDAGACARARGDPRRGLQPSGAGWELSACVQ